MASRIEDYALIGDLETAALVARNGSIDWLCFPRFDSDACFAALLGEPQHGRWQIAPAGQPKTIRRRYRDSTLILETEYETADGAVRVIDWMPPRSATEESDVMRIVEGVRGTVPMRMELIIRFDYGAIVPWVRKTSDGLRATAGPHTIYLHTDVELRGENMTTVSEFSVSEGERVPFVLTWTPTYGPEFEPPQAEASLPATEKAWRDWFEAFSYDGEWRDAVERSLITLKALTYQPSGGLVAAPTTSLPEHLGGVRNWDYRYCWLRDATFTLYALTIAGQVEEARAWRRWLVNTVAGRPEEIQIMYGVAGERRLPELELDWLPGYEDSTPVRVGNAAYQQFQLDVFGEIMDALHLARRVGLEPNENAWRVQRVLLTFLERAWQRPDEGIWEVRGKPRHFTHSKVMAWVAFDRAMRAVEEHGLEGPSERWRRIAADIKAEVLERGFDPELNTFVQYYGAPYVDASLLMLPLVGFLPADDPRMKGTVDAIQERLMQDGLVHRYDTHTEVDGLPAGEGAFLLCTFWLVDNLTLQGRLNEAREIFEHLLDLRNDVGLLSEMYNPRVGRLLGNFPQAFSHVGLVNTARNLTEAGGPAEHRGEKSEG